MSRSVPRRLGHRSWKQFQRCHGGHCGVYSIGQCADKCSIPYLKRDPKNEPNLIKQCLHGGIRQIENNQYWRHWRYWRSWGFNLANFNSQWRQENHLIFSWEKSDAGKETSDRNCAYTLQNSHERPLRIPMSHVDSRICMIQKNHALENRRHRLKKIVGLEWPHWLAHALERERSQTKEDPARA